MRALIIFACFLSCESVIVKNIENKGELQDESSKESTVSDGKQHSSTSDVPFLPCPPDKSLHTREDIKTIINYRVKTLSIHKSVNKSYYSQAVAVRDKHMNDFKEFLSWYQNRPEHLKHNVQDIAFLRSHIEHFVKHAAFALEQYPQLNEKYEMQLNRTNILIKKLNRYKIICENNCETSDVPRRTRRSDFKGYFCSSLEDLDAIIQSKLIDFAKKLSLSMLNRVTEDDKVYTEKIHELKNNLKDVALKEFGRTMYNILNLQDEYHHFIEDLMSVDANSEVYNIKQTNLLIDAKLLELEQRIEMYGKFCRTCNEIPLRPTSISYRRIAFQNKESTPKDLVEDLLNLEYINISNFTNNTYSNIFKELNLLLHNTDSKEMYVTDFKAIQDEITKMLEEQRTRFNELKDIVAPSSITKLVKLSSYSKELLSEIHKEIEYISQSNPK